MTVLQFKRELKPDPAHGECYACESVEWCVVDGVEVGTPRGFIAVHITANGGSAGVSGRFDSLAEAQACALSDAIKRGAIYAP